MNLQKIVVPAICLLLLGAAWRSYGWQGVALVGGGLMLWVLLHYTRCSPSSSAPPTDRSGLWPAR
jgi:hypothetical protein